MGLINRIVAKYDSLPNMKGTATKRRGEMGEMEARVDLLCLRIRMVCAFGVHVCVCVCRVTHFQSFVF